MTSGSRLRTTSSPFIPGISMSTMAIWGAAAAIVATASRSRSSAGGSSSTRTTRRTSSGGIGRPVDRDDHGEAAAVTRTGAEPGGIAIARLQPLTDILDADAGAGLQARFGRAVVIHGAA